MAPTLAKGEIVVLDSSQSQGQAGRDAILAKGAHLPFPPLFSPDLNPIEQVFAKPNT